MASGTVNEFSGTAGATIAETFFDGKAVGTGQHSPASDFFLENTDGAESLDYSLSGGTGWITLAPTESASLKNISNSRNSFLVRRNAGADATYSGYCAIDPRRAQ